MNESTITVRYAKALYQVGEESGTLDVLKADVQNLFVVIEESQEFSELIQSPVINTSEKIRLFEEVFGNKLNELICNFFKLLAKNKREQFLPNMCREFLQIYKEKQGIKEAVITTAQPLEKAFSEEIHKFLTKKFKLKLEITEKVNPDLIGGFRLRIDDQQVDATILSQLRKIKTELINA